MMNIKTVILLCLFNFSIYATNQDWFQVWDRPEYKEWATPIEKGYLLHIIRVEKDNNYLIVKAKLIIAEKGLPSFEVIEQLNFSDKEKAIDQINKWSDNKIDSKL